MDAKKEGRPKRAFSIIERKNDSMKRWVVAMGLVVGASALTACGGDQAANSEATFVETNETSFALEEALETFPIWFRVEDREPEASSVIRAMAVFQDGEVEHYPFATGGDGAITIADVAELSDEALVQLGKEQRVATEKKVAERARVTYALESTSKPPVLLRAAYEEPAEEEYGLSPYAIDVSTNDDGHETASISFSRGKRDINRLSNASEIEEKLLSYYLMRDSTDDERAQAAQLKEELEEYGTFTGDGELPLVSTYEPNAHHWLWEEDSLRVGSEQVELDLDDVAFVGFADPKKSGSFITRTKDTNYEFTLE